MTTSENLGFRQLISGGHGFILDEDGEINVWVMDQDYHNGPGCAFCHSVWCEHCDNTHEKELCPSAPIVIQESVVRKAIESEH